MSGTVLAGFALQSLDSFFRNDGNHDEGRHGVGPPQAEEGVGQQDGGQVGAKLRLFGIRVHGGAA